MVCGLEISDNMSGGELLVGVGTLVLAGFTYWLGRAARNEGSQVAAQVAIERERLEGETRPYVVPAPDTNWTQGSGAAHYAGNKWRELLPVKNLGPGAALNVRGTLQFVTSPDRFVLAVPTSVGPGDREDLRLAWVSDPRNDWERVSGDLEYWDISGAQWITRFRIDEHDGFRLVHVSDVERILPVAGDDSPVHKVFGWSG
jgi:hypothetical protein